MLRWNVQSVIVHILRGIAVVEYMESSTNETPTRVTQISVLTSNRPRKLDFHIFTKFISIDLRTSIRRITSHNINLTLHLSIPLLFSGMFPKNVFSF